MKKLLFFDDFLFIRQRNIVRRFHEPQWLHNNLYKDPTTGHGIGYGSVLPAPDSGYFLYYITVLKGNKKALGLAKSPDGIHWEPARFDPPWFDGHPHIVFPQDAEPHGSAMAVYHDPSDPDPARRYKAINPRFIPNRHITMAYSPDGLTWHRRDDHLVLPRDSDTMLSMLKNPRTGMYQVHMRPYNADRRIFRIQSPDCVTWGQPELVLHPSPLDAPMTQFYGMPQFQLGEVFLAFLWLYHTPFDTPSHLKHTGWVETELVYSYDGLTWNRTHRPFMPRLDWHLYGGGSQYGTAMLQRENDILIYSSANIDEHQHVRQTVDCPALALLTGTLRNDGFVGFTTRDGGLGEFYTDSLFPRSSALSFNLLAPRGAMRVAICDTNCNPLPGYTLDDCIPITGDGHSLTPRWKQHDDLTAARALLAQQPDYPGWMRLHIEFERAELFAINGDFGLDLRSPTPGINLP